MVDEAEVFRVADAIVAEGRKPTQREIRDLLSGRGSFRDIGPAFVAWLTKEGFRPRATRESVPKLLAEKLRAVAAEIWADGRRQGALLGDNERVRLAVERDALRQANAELAEKLDKLRERHDVEGEPANTECPDGRKATVELYTEVMQEIADLLVGRELTARQIIGELSKETLRRARHLRERGGAGLLSSKMKYQITKGRYFTFDSKKNVFGRLNSESAPSDAVKSSTNVASTIGVVPHSPGSNVTAPDANADMSARPSVSSEVSPAGSRRRKPTLRGTSRR